VSWRLIARKDFEDVVRSGAFWAIIAVSLVLMGVVAFSLATDDLATTDEELVYVIFSSLGAQFILPVAGLVFGYLAIAGERESGSLRVLFGLTHSRTDIMFGKLVSRCAVMLVGGAIAVVATALIIVALFDSFAPGAFLWFTILTVLLTLAFTAIAVGISAVSRTRGRAMAGAVGSYLLFFFIWHPLLAVLHYAIKGHLANYLAPDWYLFGLMLNPLEAYREAIGLVTGQYVEHLLDWNRVVESVTVPRGETARLSERAFDAPVYLSEWAAVVVLLLWFITPIIVGYWQFQRADLS